MLFKPVDEREQNALFSIGWAVAAVFAAGYAIARVTGVPLDKIVPPCILLTLTGYYCPGCGGTRAVLALLRGDILYSLYCHPMVLYAAALYAWFLLSNTLQRISHGRIRIGMRYRHIYAVIAVVLIILSMAEHNILKIVFGIEL